MRRSSERGFALLIVLWTLTLLTLLTTGLTASGRGEVQLAQNLRDAAEAEAAADGAAQEAIFRVVAGQWMAGPQSYRLRIGAAAVAVQIKDEADLINLNAASAPLLASLLRALGVDAATALVLANEIQDYHSVGGASAAPYIAAGLPYGPALHGFGSVAELRLLPGMTPALSQRLAPHLSVAKWPEVYADADDPIVASALHSVGPDDGGGPPNPAIPRLLTVRVAAVAQAGRARFTRVAEAQIHDQVSDGNSRQPPYELMSWSRGEE